MNFRNLFALSLQKSTSYIYYLEQQSWRLPRTIVCSAVDRYFLVM